MEGTTSSTRSITRLNTIGKIFIGTAAATAAASALGGSGDDNRSGAGMLILGILSLFK